MPQEHFYVSHFGQQIGPLSVDEILQKIKDQSLDINDYVFDEELDDWVVLMAHSLFATRLKSMRPAQAPPKDKPMTVQSPACDSTESPGMGVDEWYVLKGDNKFGPYSFVDLVRMLQEKNLLEFDFVWCARLGQWQMVSTLPDFGVDKLKAVEPQLENSINEVYFRRRHARVPVGTSLIVHNNKKVFNGKAQEIGAGGAGLLIPSDEFQIGDRLFLHFKPGHDMPPFHAHCEVVTKKIESSSETTAFHRYGVKFTKIETKTVDSIKTMAKQRVAS